MTIQDLIGDSREDVVFEGDQIFEFDTFVKLNARRGQDWEAFNSAVANAGKIIGRRHERVDVTRHFGALPFAYMCGRTWMAAPKVEVMIAS